MHTTSASAMHWGYYPSKLADKKQSNNNRISADILIKQPSFCGYKQQRKIKRTLTALAAAITAITCMAKPAMIELEKFDIWKNSSITKIADEKKGFNLDEIINYITHKTRSDANKIAAKSIDDAAQKLDNEASKIKGKVAPDAHVEIAALNSATYTEKNQRLYKLYNNNEYNPQLKEYLISCRMNYMNEKMKPEWAKLANQFCEKYQINSTKDKLTIISQMVQESALKENARSDAGAYGLMQIMPSTAKAMNKMYTNSKDKIISFDSAKDYKNVSDNIELGVAVMTENLRRYKDCSDPIKTSLAAYNAGSPAADAYLHGKAKKSGDDIINPEKIKTANGIPPYGETELYVKIIEDTRDYMQAHLNEMNKTIKQQIKVN